MKLSHTLTVLVLFLLASIAEASLVVPNFVWFEAAPATATSSVATQGVLGGDLVLQCDTSAGPTTCEWDITMRMTSSVQFGTMATDLLGDTGRHSISAIGPGNFPSDATGHQAANAGGTLAVFKEVNIPVFDGPDGPEFDPTDGAPGDYLLLTFTLIADRTLGDTTTDGIDARINELLWVGLGEPGTEPPETLVQFGDAAPLDGRVVDGIAESVIIIQNVPEPSTALLFGIATGFALLQRKRK